MAKVRFWTRLSLRETRKTLLSPSVSETHWPLSGVATGSDSSFIARRIEDPSDSLPRADPRTSTTRRGFRLATSLGMLLLSDLGKRIQGACWTAP